MPVSNEEIVEALLRPIEQSLKSNGITPQYLAKKLKRELNAKVTKTFKLKGAVKADSLPRAFKIVSTSGVLSFTADANVYGDGDTLIRADFVEWGTRQKARMDAHKLLNHYPAEKHEVGGPEGGPIEIDLKWPENGNGINGKTS